jgi:6-phosphogluconolactonase (cycloisomerase 2 family)
MKYLITESQINKLIFTYLDNQDFIKFEKNNYIYFVNSEGDSYAQIKYDINDKWCMINYQLIDEINSFFSTDDSTSRILITQWFENTLQIMVSGSVAGLSQYGFHV